ncbi:MAG: metallophosphoesterase family protein [Alphaproteobacteria bacterium]|nr:metallophosphoesterase family protein [Alphaproteobacteria bacterium]
MPLALLLLGCVGRNTADTADLVHYSAPADCGPGVAPGSVEGLVRWPYPQWVTTSAATVAWGGLAGTTRAKLWWGRSGDNLKPEVASASLIYVDDEGTGANLWTARIEGLRPGTEYCYGVEVDGVMLASGLRLRTAPESPWAPVRFMVIGDFGAGTEDQMALRDVMLSHAEGVDLLLTTGDNAYSSGTWGEFQRNVFEPYQEMTTRVVVYPTPGNHDYSTDEAAPYLANYVLPTNAWREADAERYYSMDWGPMHFIGLDTETPALQIRESDTDDQLDWLRADLAEADRPWTVAAWHKPAVSGHATRSPDIFALGYFKPALEEAGAQLVLQGHNHFYERFYPIQGEALADDGVTYITTGGGGRSLYPQKDDERRAVGVIDHHFLLGEVTGCRLSIEAINKQGEVIDRFELTRCDGDG